MSFHLKIIGHLTSSLLQRDNIWICAEATYHSSKGLDICLEGKLRNTITEYNAEQENFYRTKSNDLFLLSENDGNSFREKS